MIKSFITAWKKAFDFKGKTSRKDFWFYQLVSFLLFLALNVTQNLVTNLQYYALGNEGDETYSIFAEIFAVIGQTISIISFLLILGSIVIHFSITVRRLRDIQKKWTWIFIQLIPILGWIYFELYLMTRPSRVNTRTDDFIDQKLKKIKPSTKLNNKTLNNKKRSKNTGISKIIDENQISNSNTKQEKTLKEKLADLKELFDQNLINEEEYNNLKSKILGL